MKWTTKITEPSEPFSLVDYDEALEIGQELWEAADAEGLKMVAAPQIGINRSVFFIELSLDRVRRPYVVVNPHYITVSDEMVKYKEGNIYVLRRKRITVDWWDGSKNYSFDPVELGPSDSDLGRRKGKLMLECALWQAGYDYVNGCVPEERNYKTMAPLYGVE